ncbi:MAG: Xaa-Pro aminopeptidase 1 [Chloroflexota bacterium]
MTTPAEFARRRQQLMRTLAREAGKDTAAIFVAADEVVRNGDVHHAYRQESTFWYLTGFEEPEAVLVLRPGHEQPVTMFVRPHDPVMAVWVGPRAGVDGATSVYGADAAHPIEDLETVLPKLLGGVRSIYYALGSDRRVDALITRIVSDRRDMAQRGPAPVEAVREPSTHVDAQRLIKSAAEVRSLQRAIDITGAGLAVAMAATRPGMYEYEVQAVLEQEYRRLGSPREGFPTIAASGENSCTLHYVSNRRQIQRGDLMLLDTGAEWDYYSADVTRTYPASGRFTTAQRDVYDIVLASQEAGIAKTAPGVAFHAVHQASLRVLVEGLIDLKVLRGTVESNIERETYRPYYMHSTSHWLGLDVHDAGAYRSGTRSTTLRPGMVLTVEPGLYFAPGSKAAKRLQGIGIRIEDDVLVTPGGRRVLSGRIPKTPDALEALVGSAR